MTTRERPRLGDQLVAAGVLTEAQLERALGEQSSWGGRLGQNLIALGLIDEETLTRALSRQLGLPTVDLDGITILAEVVRLVPVGLAERYGLVPLAAEPGSGRLRLACFDPFHVEAMDAVQAATGLRCEPVLASPSSIHRAIRRHFYGEEAPAAPPGGPRFNVTGNTMDPAAGHPGLPEVEARLAALEARLDELARTLAGLLRDRSRGGPA